MGTRGPKSAAEISTIEQLESMSAYSATSRLPAPSHLTEYERLIWLQTVDNRPASWFTPADIPILTQYVRHVCNSETIAQMILAMKPGQLKRADGLKKYDQLLKMQERETRAISALARSMRLTQQSTYNAKNSNTLKDSEGHGAKPWE